MHGGSIRSSVTDVSQLTARWLPARPLQRLDRSRSRHSRVARPAVLGGVVNGAAVQRSHSPSRFRTGQLSVPEAPPAANPGISQHPDAVKRQQAAEER